jgi:pyruvate/2-oxoglutarate dehydrogenase complex dihydrolipoamide dehydrogenase (E3) component
MNSHEPNIGSGESPGALPRTIHYTVDGESQETTERTLTPRQIIIAAGLNPAERYLVEIKGKHQESYKDAMDTPIHMHEGQKFVTVFTGPTQVA